MPALPLDEAGKYVAAAYIVFLTVILIYVGIMAIRLRRLERRMEQLNDERPGAPGDSHTGIAAGTGREGGGRSAGETTQEATAASMTPARESHGDAAAARGAADETGGRRRG